MILYDTPEMERLKKIYKPYVDDTKAGVELVEDAPEEVVKAYNKYFELSKKQYDDEVKSWFE